MSHQNRFLLPHQPTCAANQAASTAAAPASASAAAPKAAGNSPSSNQENEFQVDIDFDSYWEEEARNPHRNRIRIGRQYQATVPQMLKSGERDSRKLEDLETLSFCPKRSAKVSNAELDHYFTVAKSLNLFASLVETRSLLGRDVTIADLNRIRLKEGLSLASVIQPARVGNNGSNPSPQSSQQVAANYSTSDQPQKSPPEAPEGATSAPGATESTSTATVAAAATELQQQQPEQQQQQQELAFRDTFVPDHELMKALSHFISLHHPCHHDTDCKKLLRESPLEPGSPPAVSIKASNLRGQAGSSQTPSKLNRFRASTKQQSAASKFDETDFGRGEHASGADTDQANSDMNNPSAHYDEWTREEVKLFSQAIEVCGKNFSSIKKEFLPSKSIRSIVEYYYIGSREVSDGKRKSSQGADAADKCSAAERAGAHNFGGKGGPGGPTGHSPSCKSASSSNLMDISKSTGPVGRSNSEPVESNRGAPPSENNADADRQTNPTSTKTGPRQAKSEIPNGGGSTGSGSNHNSSNSSKSKSECIDARMSVYNFDDEIKEESSPMRLECPRPGAEVKPLKAKPIMPNAPDGSEASNSNVGSLKFFKDGQLVLKLNACQEQQKCHWVQSGDKIPAPSKQKRYTKRASDRMSDVSQNGSQSNSVLSSNQDEDSKTEDLTADEDSKESANSFTNISAPRQKSQSASPSPKRSRAKTETGGVVVGNPSLCQNQLPSPIDYNRIAVNNRMKERNDNMGSSSLSGNSNSINNINIMTNNNPMNASPIASTNHPISSNLSGGNLLPNNPLMSQAAAMPWLQANSFAMAAALLGGLPFPPAPNNLMGGPMQNVVPSIVNLASRPMDLSVEHQAPKPIQTTAKSSSRSKSKHKNN